MQIHPEMAAVLEQFKDAPPMDFVATPVPEIRKLMDHMAFPPADLPMHEVREIDIPGGDGQPLKLRLYRPGTAQAGGNGQIASRAVTRHHQLPCIAVQLGRMQRHPARGSIGVVQRSGKDMLGSQTVIDRHNIHAGQARQVAAQVVMRFQRAYAPATTVKIDHDRRCLRSAGTVQAQLERLAVATGDVDLTHLVHGQVGRREGHVVHQLADFGHRSGHEIHGRSILELLQHGSHFGVYLHWVSLKLMERARSGRAQGGTQATSSSVWWWI